MQPVRARLATVERMERAGLMSLGRHNDFFYTADQNPMRLTLICGECGCWVDVSFAGVHISQLHPDLLDEYNLMLRRRAQAGL